MEGAGSFIRTQRPPQDPPVRVQFCKGSVRNTTLPISTCDIYTYGGQLVEPAEQLVEHADHLGGGAVLRQCDETGHIGHQHASPHTPAQLSVATRPVFTGTSRFLVLSLSRVAASRRNPDRDASCSVCYDRPYA